jgi:predicted aspartyl protease
VATAGEFATTVDMRDKGAATFYVQGEIAGLGPIDLMVDTGSGYTTINEEILARLQGTTHVRYVRQMRGRLANGTEMNVAVYAIGAVNIGGNCWLKNVEAAVFPGKTRPILGLNALQRTAPFIFSFQPPRLHLSNCTEQTAQTTGSADVAAFE